MYEIEEVIVNDGEYEETEYLADALEKEKSTKSPVKKKEPVEIPIVMPSITSVSGSEGPTPAKKKVPIVRKPGEVVTPVHMRASTAVKVSPSVVPSATTPVQKTAWTKVAPPGTNALLKAPEPTSTPIARISKVEREPSPDSDKDNPFDHEYGANTGIEMRDPTPPGSPRSSESQLNRIEKKLDQILMKLGQHDNALKLLKYNIKDLRIELKTCSKPQSETTNYETQQVPMKRERKRLVVFPVADDNYFDRLEELVQADDEIREEVITLFHDAPTSSVYEFMRKNTVGLFDNTSKYTWTGKPSNSLPSMPPSLAACKLTLVEMLITCGSEKFPNCTRDSIEKEFRRALSNFNDAKYTKKKRRMEKAVLLGTYDGIV